MKANFYHLSLIAFIAFLSTSIGANAQYHDSIPQVCNGTTNGTEVITHLLAPSGAAGDGTLTIYYEGDFGSTGEFLEVYSETGGLLKKLNGASSDCAVAPTEVLLLDQDSLLVWAADGQVSFTYTSSNATTAVNNICGPSSNSSFCVTPVLDYMGISGPNDAGVASIDSPSNFCAGTHPLIVTLQNYGTNQIDTIRIGWSIDGTTQIKVFPNVSLDTLNGAGSHTQQIIIDTLTFSQGQVDTVKVWTANPNLFSVDTVNANDTAYALLQPALAGNFTIGGTSPDFATFSAAVSALNNAGLCGPVVFDVAPGTYTEQVVIGEINGASAVNTITFNGSGVGSTMLQYSASSSSDWATIMFDGADYVTFKNMTIEALGSSYGIGAFFTNSADHNTLDSVHVKVNTNSTSSNVSGIISSGSATSTTTTGNSGDYNVISNSTVEGGYYGIRFNGGGSSSMADGNKVINVDLFDWYYYGIYFYYQNLSEFRSNTVTHTRSNNFADGMYIYYNSNFHAEANIVNAPDFGMYMYYANYYGPTQFANVINNMVSSETDDGIYTFNATDINFYYNSVRSGGARAMYHNSPDQNVNVVNNNLYAENDYAFYTSVTSAFGTVDYNNYHREDGGAIVYWGGAHSTIASLQASSGKNANSLSADPGFFSATDLHATSGALNGNATPLASVSVDVEGDSRDPVNPDIGADEFTPPPNDLSLLTVVSPAKYGCGFSDSTEVCVAIVNNGTAMQDTFNVALRIYNFVVANETVTTPILPGDTLIYCFVTTVDFSINDLYPLYAWVNLPGDQITNNDTMPNVYPVQVDSTISSFPYIVDFEPTGVIPVGWLNDPEDAGEDWQFANSSSSLNGLDFDHTTGTTENFAWIDNSFPHSAPTNLLTPCIDLTVADPFLEFWYINNANGSVILHIDVQENNVWHNDIQTSSLGDQGVNQWTYQLVSLQQFAGSTVRVRFRAEETNTTISPDIGIDDIKIFNLPPINTGVTTLNSPTSACGLTSSETIEVEITHTGYDTLNIGDVVPVNYQVNGGPVVTENVIISSQVLQFGTFTHTFNTQVDLSTPGDYDLKVWTSYPTDSDFTNDTLTTLVVHVPYVSTYPYFEDFESGTGGWSPDGTNSSWELGTPNNTIINFAASGMNAWVTALSDNYNDNEESWMIGPCFDFTNLTDPQITMKIWWDIETSWDGAVLQASTNDGASWVTIGGMGDDVNWYNDNTINASPGGSQVGWSGSGGAGSGGWVHAKHRLDNLAGEPTVRLRIAFSSDAFVTNEGLGIDDIAIGETPSIAIADTVVDCGYVVLDPALGADYIHNWSTGETDTSILVLAGSSQTSNTYSVYVEGDYGFYNEKEFLVILDPGPYVELGPDTLVCGGTGSLQLDAGNPGMHYAWNTGAQTQQLNIDQDGEYYVAVTNGVGCVKYDTVDVDFEEYPQAVLSHQPMFQNVIQFNGSASQHASSYYWDFGNGYFSTNVNPQHAFPQGGSNTVMLITTNVCGSDTATITISNVGIEELANGSTFEIYPNPTTGMLTIELSAYGVEDVKLSVVDVSGRQIMNLGQHEFSGKTTVEADLRALAKGVYFIRLESAAEAIHQKIILQ